MQEKLQDLIRKYPKMAIQGKKVLLDAEWKKAFVAFLSMALINVDISRKMLGLSNQLSDSFNDSLRDWKKIELNDSTKKDLQITFRIKNLLLSSADTLYNQIPKLDQVIKEGQSLMDRDLYLYYIGAKTTLLATLEESRKTAGDIDATLSSCFKDAIIKGASMESIEEDTLNGIDTRGDINKILDNVYESVGLVM